MTHHPTPRNATPRELRAIHDLHHQADRAREPGVRSALAGALAMIVELIEDRGRRHDFDEQRDAPHDGGE